MLCDLLFRVAKLLLQSLPLLLNNVDRFFGLLSFFLGLAGQQSERLDFVLKLNDRALKNTYPMFERLIVLPLHFQLLLGLDFFLGKLNVKQFSFMQFVA